MTRRDFIKKLEELKEEFLTELSPDEITDHAREEAYMCICAAIEYIAENNED